MMRRIFGREWEKARPHDWAIVITAMAAVALRWLQGPQVVDDAFITFRYARNLAAGLGFVYNVGERVLGTTTPLFTLLLAALGSALPVSHAHLRTTLLRSERFRQACALSMRVETQAWGTDGLLVFQRAATQ